MAAFLAELLGTMLLVILGNGVVANLTLRDTKSHGASWLGIATGWGLAVYVAVLATQDVSGAHINPAVTLSLAIAGKFSWSLVLPYVVAQLLGAFAGACVVWWFFRDHFARTRDPAIIQGCFCTSPAIGNAPSNYFSEIVGTAILVTAALSITGGSFRFSRAPGDVSEGLVGLGSVGALPIGLVVFSIGLSLGGTTGYAINPARDVAPRLAHQLLPIAGKGDSDWSYALVPLLGPFIGGAAAAALWLVLEPVM